MPAKHDWFSAHKDGLKQIVHRQIERRGFGFVAGELYQNVRDELTATKCEFELKPYSKGVAILKCADDGKGFADLTHAWMMFAPSAKKGNPELAGRFNVGEKHVLSLCDRATIFTTSGTVVFDDEGREEYPRRKRQTGTIFDALIECTKEQIGQFHDYLKMLIVRPGLTVTFNGEKVGLMNNRGTEPRKPKHVFTAKLMTEKGEDLRLTQRKTEVQVFEVLPGETPMLYELGIPVVEIECQYHVNIGQKVPLNVDRDNVRPSYLRDVYAYVFNEMHEEVEPEDTVTPWVTEATSSGKVHEKAFGDFMTKRFGENPVTSTPGMPEADHDAQAHNRTVIRPADMTPGQREAAKEFDLLHSSAETFGHQRGDIYATVKDLTNGMILVKNYAMWLAEQLLNRKIKVSFVRRHPVAGHVTLATYGLGNLDFNVDGLAKDFFDHGASVAVDKLLIHEFGHEYESDHLSRGFEDACCMLGAKLKKLALTNPEGFRIFQDWESFTKGHKTR